MYYIYNYDDETFYADNVCVCLVWKRHHTRAAMFVSRLQAQVIMLGLATDDSLDVVTLDEYFDKYC